MSDFQRNLLTAFVSEPAINSVTPSSGPVAGNNVITIDGVNLGSGADITSVTIGSVVATVVSQTRNSVVATAGQASSPHVGDVVVHSASVGKTTKAAGYSYMSSAFFIISLRVISYMRSCSRPTFRRIAFIWPSGW